MQRHQPLHLQRQSGVVLVVSLLLLLVVTLLALSMFRSNGVQELIAGSLREKDRALQSATSAEQYAEYWMTTGNNIDNTFTCGAPLLNANSGDGYVCTNSLASLLGSPAAVAAVPWGGSLPNSEIGIQYTPPGMSATAGGVGINQYFEAPRFYVQLVGSAPVGQGQIYQIDAWGYGGDPNTVVVIESTYLVTTSVVDLGAG
jgi:type IV pilus assembly protein PilX